MAVKKAGNSTLRKLAIEPKKKWTHDMTPEEELNTPMGRILSVYREKKRAYVDPEEKNQEYRRKVWQKQQEQQKAEAQAKSMQRTQNNFNRFKQDKVGAMMDDIRRKQEQRELKNTLETAGANKLKQLENNRQQKIAAEEKAKSAQRTQNNFNRMANNRIGAMMDDIKRRQEQRELQNTMETAGTDKLKQLEGNRQQKIAAEEKAETAATDQAAQKEANQNRFDRFMDKRIKPIDELATKKDVEKALAKYQENAMRDVNNWSQELRDYFAGADPAYMEDPEERKLARQYWKNEDNKAYKERSDYILNNKEEILKKRDKWESNPIYRISEALKDNSLDDYEKIQIIKSITQSNEYSNLIWSLGYNDEDMPKLVTIKELVKGPYPNLGNTIIEYIDKLEERFAPEMIPAYYDDQLKHARNMLAELDKADQTWGEINGLEAGVPEETTGTGYTTDILHRRDIPESKTGFGLESEWYADTSINGLDNPLEVSYVISQNQEFYKNEVPKSEWYPELYMTPKQVDTFAAYMKAGKRDEAQAYYDAIKPFLNEKLMQHHEQKWREVAHINSGSEFTVGVASLGYKLVGGLTGTIGTFAALLGDKEAKDKNSLYYYLTNISNAIRDERGDAWGQRFENIFGEGGYEVGKFASGVAYSMMDNALAMAVAGGIGGGATKVSQGAVQLIMSSESTADAMVQNLSKGMGVTESALLAIGSGAIEALTEKYSLEALLDPNVKEFLGDWKKMAAYIGKNVLAEGSEEGASDVLNLIMEKELAVLFNHRTEIEQETDEYVRKMMAANPGYTKQDVDKWQREGMAQAWGGWWQQLGLDVLAGGVSGFGMSAIRAGANEISYRSTGKNILEGSASKRSEFRNILGDNRSAEAEARKASTGKRNTDFLLVMADRMSKDGNAYQMGSDIRADMKQGKKISYGRWGKLAANIQYEGNEQVREAAGFAIEEVVREDLEKQGIGKRDAEGLAQIINKATTQGMDALNRDERNQLKKSEPAYQILEAMIRPESGRTTDAAKRTAFAAKINANIQTADQQNELDKIKSIAEGREMQNRKAALRIGKDSLKTARSAVAQATDETINALGGRDAIGREASTVIAYTGSGENAEAKAGKVVGFEKGKVKIRFADGTTQAMDPASVETTNANAQGLIGYMKAHPGMMSDDVAGKTLAALDAAGEKAAPAFAQDAVNINLAARLGRAMPMHSMDDSYARAIYDTAKAEADAADAARIKPTARVEPGKGGASWDGVKYGTKEWTKKAAALSEETRRQANAAAEIAKALGMNIEFVYDNSENGRETNGSYDEETGVVTVNLAAQRIKIDENGNKTALGSVNALATIPHEFTHWLQANSENGYRQLVQFVMNDLENSGMVIEERLKQTIDNYNQFYKENGIDRQMTLDDAVYEMVANSTEALFTSEEFASRLKKQNAGLYGKAKEYVQKLIGRIRTALSDVNSSMHTEAKLLQNVDEMAKIWLGAYDEVIHKAVKQAEVTTISREEAKTKLNENFSIQEDENGKFVQVDTEQEQFEGKTPNEIIKMAKDIILDKFQGIPFVLENGTAKVLRQTAKEYSWIKSKKWMKNNQDLVEAKGRASTELDNMINIATKLEKGDPDYPNKSIGHHIGDQKIIGWDYYKTRFKAGNQMIKAVINVAKLDGYDMIYDITQQKIDTSATTHTGENAGGATTDVKDNIPQNDKEHNSYSIQEMEKTYKSLDIDPIISFTGTMEQIDEKEKTEEARKDEFRKLIERNEFMALEFVRPSGSREILHHSTRPGVEWQLSYIGNDGIPNMHESYGPIKGQDAGKETVHSMDELYQHFVNMNLQDDLTFNVMEDDNIVTEATVEKAAAHPKKSFSINEPVEATKSGLIAVHNLTYENLMDTLKEGGFTAPSIAIIKAAMGHSKYGDISVIFKKSAIDPRKNAKNKIYGADAYTPTRYNVDVETELKQKEMYKAADDISKLVDGEDKHLYNEVNRWFSERTYKGVTYKTARQEAEEAWSNEALMAAYLKSQGKEIPIKTREVYKGDFTQSQAEELSKSAEALLEADMLKEFQEDVKTLSGRNLIEKYAGIIANKVERAGTLLNIWNEKGLDIAGKSLMKILKRTGDFLNGGSEKVTETDWYETKKAMWDMIDKENFVEWMTSKLEPAWGETGIRNNLDQFTYAGNRRTFKQLHGPYTIENVVKAMYSNATEKGQNGRYASGAVATASKEYKTLEEVKADENRLELRDQEEYDQIIEELNKRMDEMAEDFGADKSTFDYLIIEAGRNYAKNQTLEAIKRGFLKEGESITTEQAKQVKALLDDMREIPTGYFEAKPMRVMGFDEIAEAILPAKYDKLIAELERLNIPYETTDGTEEARKAALNGYTSEQFSIQEREQDIDIDQWMMSVPESSLQTDAERMLLRSYKDLNKAIEVNDENIRNLKKRISFLQEKKNKTREENNMLSALRIRLENAESARKANVEKMQAVRRTEGYANIMRQQQEIVQRFVSGKTQDEVVKAVSGMEAAANELQKGIEKTAKDLNALANEEGVKRIKSRIGISSLEKVAARIRKNYNSTINKQELQSDLSRIRLMIENGESAEDIEAEIEGLAGKILGSRKSSEKNESLEALRGITLRLSDSAMKEIYGSNSSIKEIRRMLAGSGVKVARAADGKGSLDANWSELVSFVPALDHYNGYDTENALDQMKAVAEFVQNAMAEQQESGKNELAGMMDDVIFNLTGEIAAIDMNLPADPKARKQVQGLIDYIVELSERANMAGKQVQELTGKLNDMMASGRNAANWSRSMKADIAQTIDYFKLTSKMALDQAKANKQSEIIRQLKDENVQKIIKNNEEWRALIQRDADARRQADRNAMARRKMSTVMNRINKLLSSETDQQNIPENFKGLARELLGMFVDNDMGEGGRKLTSANRKTLENTKRLLDIWEEQDGPFNLADLTTESGQDPEGIAIRVMDDIETIREAMEEWNRKYNGKNRLDTLQQMGKTLERMQEAVSEIYNIIQSARTMDINGRKYQIEEMGLKFLDGTKQSRFKGEATKAVGKAVDKIRNLAITGNTTPEYFFKNLRNKGMDEIWNEFKRGENKNGLEIAKAQKRIGEIAEKHGYKNWDMKQKHTVETLNGTVEMTTEQLMALWATWKREKTMGPEQSQHLTRGGFYVAEDQKGKGLSGRVKENARPHVMDEETMEKAGAQLTEEQKDYIDDMVAYMSSELSELGNEASMRMYGIKKYKEKYYYPFKRWSGVGNFSSDKGSQATDDNRAAHKGWTKRRMNMASNALEIGDFTKTVVNHAVEMINYNTMAPAIEAMNKVLNWQNTEYPGDGTTIKRNMRAVFGQEYGKEALNYLETLLKDMNGGVVQDPRGSTLDKLLSVFKKGAVSGSLSVAAQQPLSIIRAAMEISPKYLAMGLKPGTYKTNYREMMAHSGVAVIKKMGRFDMGYGASAKEYVSPDAYMTRGEKVREKVTDIATGLPEIMDQVTWAKMWGAVKAEQKALHPDMDVRSDEFLDMVGERFNEVMRRTQVYDSVLVKSSNMRSKSMAMKSLTSFMAEPTLSLNVLRDAAINAGEKGGAKKAAMAGATFLLSAIAQAAAKGLFGAGRNPDEKKTKKENLLYRMMYNLISEINPASLIPGYSDLVEVLTKGELTDDAMSPIGKMYDIIQTIQKANDKSNAYRLIEDTAGQITQLFTGVPLKNIMRDARAMINWFAPNSGTNQLVGGKPFAQRDTSAAVIKNQTIDTIMNKDLIGMVNKWLGDAGYQTTNSAYYRRILDAEKAGNDARVKELEEYMTLGKGKKQEDIDSEIRSIARKDDSLTNMEKAEIIAEHGGNANDLIKAAEEAGEISTAEAVDQLDYKDPTSYITSQLKDGKIDAEEARKLLKEQDPEKSDDSIWWSVDRIEYKKETGKDAGSGTYYRLKDAINDGKSDGIKNAVSVMLAHGMTEKQIKEWIGRKDTGFKTRYLEMPNGKEKVALKNALIMAYKAAGVKEAEAQKIINGWK